MTESGKLTIAVMGTLDTKGAEHEFVADCIRRAGHEVLLIDVSTGPAPSVTPDISRDEVLQAFNSRSQVTAEIGNDRGASIAAMTRAVPDLLRRLVDEGRIHGLVSLGGSGGTAIATAAMRALPLGFPKVMVSTMTGGNTSQYVGISDIVMLPSIVDVSGLNRLSRRVFMRAAATVIALANVHGATEIDQHAQPLVVASMFGNTTVCVEHARQLLQTAGYEVIVFHATGVGGRTMEALIESGIVSGVLDITTTEWADELVGGVMGGGPHRLEAAARKGIPAIVAPGCLDMVNFGEPSSVPPRFANRKFYQHNPQVTLMRTTPEECMQIGKTIGSKLNESTGSVRFVYPQKAISVLSAPGKPFHDPAADQALMLALQQSLRPDIPFDLIDCEINDQVFAQHCVDRLIEAMRLQPQVERQSHAQSWRGP